MKTDNISYLGQLIEADPVFMVLAFIFKLYVFAWGITVLRWTINYFKKEFSILRVFLFFTCSFIAVGALSLWGYMTYFKLKYIKIDIASDRFGQFVILIIMLVHGGYFYYKAIKWIKPNLSLFDKKKDQGFQDIIEDTDNDHIGFPASKPIIIQNIYRGLLISGGAGSGKSASFVYGLLNQMIFKDFSGVIYDFKNPELSEFVKRVSLFYQSQTKIIDVNFKNPLQSDRINLLHGMTKVAEVKELSSALWKNLNSDAIKNPGSFWNSSAEAILTASMFALIRLYPGYASLPHTLAILLSFSLDELVDFLSQDPQAKGLCTQLINSHQLGSNNQTSGTIGTLTNYLGVLNTPENFYILSGKTMPVPNDPNNPSILLLGNDSTLSDTISPILAMIMTAVIRKMNRPGQKKSMVVVDELPTIFLPTLKQLPAVARSNKIATCVTIQEKAQLEDSYSQDEAKVILSNLGSQVFGRSTLESTNKYISDLFGKHDVVYSSSTKGSSGGMKGFSQSKSTNYSMQQRNRIEPQQIANFKPGEFCGFIAEGTPRQFISNQVSIFDKEPFYAFDIPFDVKNVKQEMLQSNYDRIYREVEVIKTDLSRKKAG